jgi:hypothetical protein
VTQAFRVIDNIRAGTFKIRGRAISVANSTIPATVYCVSDITPSLVTVLEDLNALKSPDAQFWYGFNPNRRIYFEVIGYDKMLRDATKRNRIFFDKLNLVNDHS